MHKYIHTYLHIDKNASLPKALLFEPAKNVSILNLIKPNQAGVVAPVARAAVPPTIANPNQNPFQRETAETVAQKVCNESFHSTHTYIHIEATEMHTYIHTYIHLESTN